MAPEGRLLLIQNPDGNETLMNLGNLRNAQAIRSQLLQDIWNAIHIPGGCASSLNHDGD